MRQETEKGDKTDDVKRQYIGNLGKVENGIVAVTAYGLIEGMTFPLIFEVDKPKERLEQGDAYRTKPKIAGVEYGLKQSKNELGWADFRVTNSAQIQKWWEVVMSAYLLVSLHSRVLNPSDHSSEDNISQSLLDRFSTHDWWDEGQGWKNLLNNLRLVLQPFGFFNLIKPWLND